jgi:hypothetical protein
MMQSGGAMDDQVNCKKLYNERGEKNFKEGSKSSMNNHINLRKSGLKSPQGEEMIPKMS